MNGRTAAFEALQYGREHPLEFINNIWPGAEPWQERVIQSVDEFWKTAVVACNGAGKTWVAARIICTFLSTHPGSIVITTAGTWTQVRRQLWSEIRTAHTEMPKAIRLPQLNTTDWNIADKWYAVGKSTKDPGHFEGYHAPYVLVVVDEAKSVPQGIFDAINRIFAGPSKKVRLLVISSTGLNEGPHWEAFHEKQHIYSRILVSPFECWHETPDGVRADLPPTKHMTPEFIQQMQDEYGEDSPIYRSMVLARWSEDEAYRLYTTAMLRDMRDDADPEDHKNRFVAKIGADVGRSVAGDECCFTAMGRYTMPDGYHYQWLDQECFHTGDSTVFEDRLILFAGKWKADPRNIYVDGTGIGGPSCDHLKKHRKFRVREVQFGEASVREKPPIANRRAELWWDGATLARQGRIHGVTDLRTVAQLNAVKYTFDSRSRMLLEEKQTMARRIAKERPRSPWRSPDRGDSFNLALIEEPMRKLRVGDLKGVYAS